MGGLSAMHANRDRRLRRKAMPERLADSLMDLVRHGCFSSIDVAMIAAKTGLSRKSFYYHFSGKDELMQHALEREIGSLCMERRGWDMLVSLLRLLYADRRFYRSIHADAGSTMAMVRLREAANRRISSFWFSMCCFSVLTRRYAITDMVIVG